MSKNQITADTIRKALIDRADAFAARNRVSYSRIGLGAVNDSKFIAEARAGRNFKIGSYQAVMDWMGAYERGEVK